MESYEELKEQVDKMKATAKKRTATLKRLHGDDYFSDIAKLNKKGGFNNPAVVKKAIAVRQHNKEVRDAEVSSQLTD